MQTTVITAVMQKIQEAAKQAIPKISVNLILLHLLQKAVANFVHSKNTGASPVFFLTLFILFSSMFFHLIVAIIFPLTGYYPITFPINHKF